MNQTHLLLDDEADEQFRQGLAADGRPVTYIWDITNLEAPKQTGHYKAPRVATDHNQYVFGKYSYQSNYGAGISILDISSIPGDPSGKGVKEVGWFDVHPEDDHERGGGITDFVGSWSSYAGYPSGFILVNTIERGVFVVKVQHLE
jgi:choice-of-anchor B domain-containing protein